MINKFYSDDRVLNSTPMKLSQPVSPAKSSSSKKSSSEFQWAKVWEQIKIAEEEANRLAANMPKKGVNLAKRGSEIMISSSEDDVGLDSSYMKWLKPETAKAIKERILQDMKNRSPAAKNLDLH